VGFFHTCYFNSDVKVILDEIEELNIHNYFDIKMIFAKYLIPYVDLFDYTKSAKFIV
jgi:hypothetical protein